MAFELERERHGGVLVLALSGRLDNDNAADFELVIQEVLSAGERHLLLDLAELDYLSNAGVRALGRLAKSMATPSTSLRLAGCSAGLRQVFDAAGAAVLFEFHPDRAAALADHPAGQGHALAAEVARLLGLPPATEPGSRDKQHARLAEQALEVLGSRGRQTRAVRAMAQGTQVMQVVTSSTPTAAARKPGFWRRLFGRKR